MAVGVHELAPRGQEVHGWCGRTLPERLEARSSFLDVGFSCRLRAPERFACSSRTPHRAENRCKTLLGMPATNRCLCEAKRGAGKAGALGGAEVAEFAIRAPC